MTKYVLNSGGIVNNPNQGKPFFEEIVKDLGSNPKILMCFFAAPTKEWQERFDLYAAGFQEQLPSNILPEFTLAKVDNFAEQVVACDALYIHGGYNELLDPIMRQFDVPALWEGKVVATNSASSQMVSAHYWSCYNRKNCDGFAILPIKFIPHFRSSYGHDDPRGPVDWDKAYEELAAYGDTSLPIYALEEGDYVVIEA